MIRRLTAGKAALFALVSLIITILALRLPAEVWVRLEPVRARQPDFGSQTVIVTPDERIFTLFAALNAAGFDREYEGLAMTGIRQEVRATLAGKNIPSLERLKPIFERVAEYHLVVWVLQRGPAPEFGRAEASWSVTTRAADFAGLAEALSYFYTQADIPSLWQQVEPQYRSEISRWQPLAETSLSNVLTYLQVTGIPFRQLVVIPNPLDSYYSGNGPQIGDLAYVVAGPSETELSLQGLIEHETLHSIIGPMLDENLRIISPAQADRLFAGLKESMPASYASWASAIEETLIRSIGLRMLQDESLRTQMINQLEDEGFLLIRPVESALERYEHSHQSFEEYLPTLLETINAIQLPLK